MGALLTCKARDEMVLSSSCSNNDKWHIYIESGFQLLWMGSVKQGQFNEVGSVK